MTSRRKRREEGVVSRCISCDGVIDRVLPEPIPEDYECMWSESFARRALYCRKCYEEFE